MPALALELVRVGEETGDLAPMLLKASDMLRKEIEATATEWIGAGGARQHRSCSASSSGDRARPLRHGARCATTLRREPRAGFTLVELLIVLAIMGLVAALAFPRLVGRAPGSTLGAVAEELRAALATARSAAIAQDREVMVGGGDGSYRVDGARHVLPSAAGVRIDVRGGGIAFFPSGGSSGGRIVLRGGGRTAELDVEALTGRASFVQ